MSKPISKSLRDYISKMKKQTSRCTILPPKTLSSFSGMMKGCKQTKTLSVMVECDQNDNHDHQQDHAATLADVDRFLFENFKSLYIKDDEDEKNTRDRKNDKEELNDRVFFEFPSLMDPPPNLCGTGRFFVTTGSSASLMEEVWSSTTTSDDVISDSCSTTTDSSSDDSAAKLTGEAKKVMGPDDLIALFTYSPNPSDDFKHSMTEMIETRLRHNGKVDWEFIEELLFCYLNLNDKKSHKYILNSFVDLVVVLRENSGKLPVGARCVRSTGDGRK